MKALLFLLQFLSAPLHKNTFHKKRTEARITVKFLHIVVLATRGIISIYNIFFYIDWWRFLVSFQCVSGALLFAEWF